jgi:hypothetical protein
MRDPAFVFLFRGLFQVFCFCWTGSDCNRQTLQLGIGRHDEKKKKTIVLSGGCRAALVICYDK